jgi:uncharacterized membrane protein
MLVVGYVITQSVAGAAVIALVDALTKLVRFCVVERLWVRAGG